MDKKSGGRKAARSGFNPRARERTDEAPGGSFKPRARERTSETTESETAPDTGLEGEKHSH